MELHLESFKAARNAEDKRLARMRYEETSEEYWMLREEWASKRHANLQTHHTEVNLYRQHFWLASLFLTVGTIYFAVCCMRFGGIKHVLFCVACGCILGALAGEAWHRTSNEYDVFFKDHPLPDRFTGLWFGIAVGLIVGLLSRWNLQFVRNKEMLCDASVEPLAGNEM